MKSKPRSGYKQTEIGEIPEDWEVVRLRKVCERITDGTHKTPKYVKKGVPFLSTQNIIPFHKGFDFSQYEKYISQEEHEELIKRCKPEKGDILISKCGTIGRTKLIDVDFEFSIFVGLALLKLRKSLISGEYLEQLLNYKPFKRLMEVASPGSTRKTLTINAIENLKISLPPLIKEQQKIAEILSSADQAIQKTDDIIQKTQKFKKGLMQRLLTKGIGHTKFKQTEIGEIPEEWKVVKLGEVASVRYGLGQPPEADENGVSMIRATNIKRGKIVETDLLRVRRSAVPESRQAFLKAGDVIVVRSGAYTGDIGHVTEKWEGAVAGYDLVISPSNRIDSIFLTNYLLSSRIQGYFSQLKSRSAQPHLNAQQVSDTPIALPPLPEQKKIASILSAIDEKNEKEKQRKEQLEKLKKGLMQDLLTGRVRVKVD